MAKVTAVHIGHTTIEMVHNLSVENLFWFKRLKYSISVNKLYLKIIVNRK